MYKGRGVGGVTLEGPGPGGGGGCQLSQVTGQWAWGWPWAPRAEGWAGALPGQTPGAPGQVRQERWGSLEFVGRARGPESLVPHREMALLLRPRPLPCPLSLSGVSSRTAPLEGSTCFSAGGRDPAPHPKNRQGCLRSPSPQPQPPPTLLHFHVSPPSPVPVACRSRANHTAAFTKQQPLMEIKKEGGERRVQGWDFAHISPSSQAWVVA